MQSLLTVAATAAVFAVSAQAQLGVYGGFSTATLKLANTPRLYGGTFGVQYDSKHFPLVNFGLDVRGSVTTADNTRVTAVVAGPRLVLHLPVVPLRPYAEALVGGATVRAGQGSAASDTSGFTGGFAAGADLHLLPFIDWRVLDYNYSRLQAGAYLPADPDHRHRDPDPIFLR